MKWVSLPVLLTLWTTSFIPEALSQTNVNVFLGAGYPVSAAEFPSVYDYWKFNFVAGVTAEYQPLEHFIVAPTFSYQYIFFDEYHQYIFAEDYVVSSSGSASQLYQLGVDISVHGSRENLFDPQLLLGGGYQWMDYGSMTVTWNGLSGIMRDEDYSFPSTKTWYVSVGFATSVRISAGLFLNASIKSMNAIDYFHSYDANDWIVNANLQYRII